MQGEQVWSQTGELRPYMPHGLTRKKKKKKLLQNLGISQVVLSLLKSMEVPTFMVII